MVKIKILGQYEKYIIKQKMVKMKILKYKRAKMKTIPNFIKG